MTAALFDRVRDLAALVLEIPAGELTAQSSTESVESWDSLHHLNLVLALEEEFAIQLLPEEIDEMHSIERIAALVALKLNRG